jgi:hypothetical protein
MKLNLILIVCLLKVFVSFGQSTIFEPKKSTVSSTGTANELELTNVGRVANIVGRSSRGSYLSPLITQNSDVLFKISAASYLDRPNPFYQTGVIEFQASENWSNTNFGTDIVFKTAAPIFLPLRSRMIIKNDGKVGIGITNPKTLLHIQDGGTGFPELFGSPLKLAGSTSSSGPYLNLVGAENMRTSILFGNNFTGVRNAGIITDIDSTFKFFIGNSKIAISALDDNVAIGDIKAKAQLSVNGDIAIAGRTIISGNMTHNNLDRSNSSIISVARANPALTNTEVVSGITGGFDGVILYMYPTQGTTLQLLHLNTGSAAENRIVTPTLADITLTDNGGVTLIYNAFENKWRVISMAN